MVDLDCSGIPLDTCVLVYQDKRRTVHAIGNAQDMLIGISTSGGSKNVVCAIEAAREVGMSVGVLVSSRSGPMAELADVAIRVPSDNTARIQESHLLCVHMLCAAIEEAMG